MEQTPGLAPRANVQTNATGALSRFGVGPAPDTVAKPGFMAGVNPGSGCLETGLAFSVYSVHRAYLGTPPAHFTELSYTKVPPVIQLHWQVSKDLAQPYHGSKVGAY